MSRPTASRPSVPDEPATATPAAAVPAKRRSAVVPAVVALVAVVLAVVAFVASRPQSVVPAGSAGPSPAATVPGAAVVQTPSASPSTTDPVIEMLKGLARRTPNDPMAIGKVDAPVVMISYSEFQCPFCGRFARDTEPTLIKKYVDSGVLRIEWRDFPYLGEESTTAALAARAAAAQGEFWTFHDALYADQQPPNSGKLTPDFLAGVAQKAGLDATRFRTDLGTASVKQAVDEDFAEGQRIGVTGTPAFLINGQPIIGAQSTEVFEQAIDRARAEAP